jgi:uncharacterized protein YjiS (DUF1127 family)
MNTETTYNDYQPAVDTTRVQSGAGRAASAVKRAVRRILKTMLRAHWERETAAELSRLPAYMLRDIGMREDDIHVVARDLARERADAWARQAQRSNGFGG